MTDAAANPALPHRLDWDGGLLRVSAAPGAAIEIWLDDQPYARLRADLSGQIELALPLAPNGRERINLQLRTGNAQSAMVALQFGRAGLARAGEVLPLAPLIAQDFVDVAARAAELRREVAIVVPVYNAPAAVAACLDSVLAQTRGPARLIVIDDASPDPAIAPLLARYADRHGVTLLRNENNLGFTATANRGIEAAGRADVVLLNADTEVAAHWLEGLRRAAWAAADTASATAVSDNAGAFSVPELEQHNPFPDNWIFGQAALAVRQTAGSAYPYLPTGNGFCLYLKREALDAVGLLDARAFAQGYGEENDWCQRAEAAGWRHVIAGDVLVRHARSQSFGDERRARLGEAGMAVLRERWPHYESEVGASLFSPRRRVLDWRVRKAYASAPPQPRRLYWEQSDTTDAAGWHLQRDREGLLLRRPGAAPQLHERLPEATVATAAAQAGWNASFARLLQIHAIDEVVGALPPAFAGIAQLLGVSNPVAPPSQPFGDDA